MWNRPQLMTAVADLLFLAGAAALLLAGIFGLARLPIWPVREFVVTNALQEVRREDLARAFAETAPGNFFSLDLESIRRSLEKQPWVRHAELRRHWPARLDVQIEEHVPAAFWRPAGKTGPAAPAGETENELVNSYGEVFTAARHPLPNQGLPLLSGPPGLAGEVLAYYQEAEAIVQPLGRRVRALSVSPRLAIRLQLDDGMLVELGRPQAKAPMRERLRRFAEYYPGLPTAAEKRPSVVDMRYPSGFALRLGAAASHESKGKP